ncbi:MAG: tyrosine-type recombinase/integrase [Synergistaceae bacterium]|nr:tyrosine-type recombinase/integrase [Synergistaceae bacterium]
MKSVTISNQLVKSQSTLSQNLFDKFIQFLDVAPTTARTYQTGIKRFAEYLNVNGISTPTAQTVINFKKALTDAGRKSSTVAIYLAALHRFFTWTASENLFPNITVGIKSPKLSKGHKKDCFSASQLKGILRNINRSNIEGMRDYAIMSLMSCAGLRCVEVSRAKIEDLRTVGGVPVLFVQGKGRLDKADFVKIPEKVEEAIRQYLKMRGKVDATEALFASESKRNRGECLTTRSISRLCKSAMINAGFDSSRLTAHSLRHSAITLALIKGADITETQAFARHMNIQTTQIYNHSVNRLKSNIENSIANEIF